MGPVDYNVARAAEVEAEEASLLRRFGRTSHGGAGTAARPMTRPVTQYQKTMVVEGKIRVSVKSRFGKMLAQSVRRKTRPRRVDESLEFGREVADLRERLGLDEEEKMTKGIPIEVDRVLTLIPDSDEDPKTSAQIVAMSGLSTTSILRVLKDLVDDGTVCRTFGKAGGKGGRAPGLYKRAGKKAKKRAAPAHSSTHYSPPAHETLVHSKDEVTTGDCLELDDILTPLREQLEQFIERRAKARSRAMLKRLLDGELSEADEDEDAG